MKFVNATKMEAGCTMGLQPDGRELLVAVVKGTFTVPIQGQAPRLAEKQQRLIETDVFTREPGFSAPLYEIDFAPRKPHCDVLLNGSAYSPDGKPVPRVTVALRIGGWKKSFDVVGNRTWTKTLLSLSSSAAEPFTKMPFSYDNAFGGVDKGKDESEPDHYFLENHVGLGYHLRTSPKLLDGKPLPNTEESGKTVSKPDGYYRPMAFGPIGRAWKQRVQYAGTYDQQWLDEVFPFLPQDFRDEYYQAAPFDQWIDYPQGGVEVELINLTPRGRIVFQLPDMQVPFEFHRRNGERVTMAGVIDTLLFESDAGRFTMTSRCTLPLKKNIHEMQRVIVGKQPEPRATGKRRFESLDEMIKARKRPAARG